MYIIIMKLGTLSTYMYIHTYHILDTHVEIYARIINFAHGYGSKVSIRTRAFLTPSF